MPGMTEGKLALALGRRMFSGFFQTYLACPWLYGFVGGSAQFQAYDNAAVFYITASQTASPAERCFSSKRTSFTQPICAPAARAILHPAEILEESSGESLQRAQRHLGDSGVPRTLFLASKHCSLSKQLRTRAPSVSLGSTAHGSAKECGLLRLLWQQRRDLRLAVGRGGSSKSPPSHRLKRQLDKSKEEIPTEAIKHRVLLLVEESPASPSAG